MITAIMCDNDTMAISNRDLNEVANFMKNNGHGLIAKNDIIPIVLKTAADKSATAIIRDKTIQSHIKHIVSRMVSASIITV